MYKVLIKEAPHGTLHVTDHFHTSSFVPKTWKGNYLILDERPGHKGILIGWQHRMEE